MARGSYLNNADISGTPYLRKTRFNEFLIQKNALDERGFKEWILCTGMLFNARDKWWGDNGKRDRPHEGIDLCLYRNRRGKILPIDKNTKIPAMYDGVVVRIINDFLGKSLILEHSFGDSDNGRFYTIYGHIIPYGGLHVDRTVKEGDIIGTLSDSVNLKLKIFPHLHISIGWTSRAIPHVKIDWKTISSPDTLTLLNPIVVIDGHYMTLECVSPQCHNIRQAAGKL